MDVYEDRIILIGDNKKHLSILRKDIDKYIVANSLPVIEQFESLGLLPEFLQGTCTLIPIAKSVVWAYSMAKNILIIIPQNNKKNYIYYRNMDKDKLISFICNMYSLRI